MHMVAYGKKLGYRTNKAKWVSAGRVSVFALAAVSVAGAAGHSSMAQVQFGGEPEEHSWPFWGGNLSNTHAGATKNEINPDNAVRLQQK